MQVVIFCGGLGTRLRQEAEFKPKPMVTIGGKPLLWHLLRYYSHFGLRDFVLCLGYRGEAIRNYFANFTLLNSDCSIDLCSDANLEVHRNDTPDWRVTLVDTGPETLKGARLKRVERYITGDELMVTYGDGLANIDLHAMLAFHRQHGQLGTVTGVNPTARFGELKVDGNQVLEFFEKPILADQHVNGGFFVFKRDVFDYLTDDESCDFETGALEQIARAGQLQVFRHQAFWACMDTPRDVEYLNGLWDSGQAPWKIWD